VDLVRAKVSVFALGGCYAAVAGSLYAHHVTYISPDEFGLLRSIQFLIVVIVGGLTSVWGAVVGAVVLALLTEAGRELVPLVVSGATGPYELVIYGLILVVVLVFFPRGIAGSTAHAFWKRRQSSAQEATSQTQTQALDERVDGEPVA
jgi:branched-chain amino acid transport system permease protein